MILLDTDHLSIHAFPESAQFESLAARMRHSTEEFGTTIVCLEEQLRGWLAEIKRKHDLVDQISAYAHLGRLWEYFRNWKIVPFDARAAEFCKNLRKRRIRIGARDLKIAGIALAQDALLLSANLRDFRQVPGLRVEDWLSA